MNLTNNNLQANFFRNREFNQIYASVFIMIFGESLINIFVPVPNRDPNNIKSFFWDTNNLEVKVAKIIGVYDIYRNLEGVAQRSNIKIR